MNMATVESNFDASEHAPELDDTEGSFSKPQRDPYQIHNTYLVNHLKSGFILIDQQAASERVLYERYLLQLADKPIATQAQLFPKTIYFSPNDAVVLREILPEINKLGFDIQEFGGESFIVHGLPSDWQGEKDEQKVIEKLLEQYKIEVNMKLDIDERIAASMARSAAIKRGTPLSIREMQELIDQLFACDMPFKSPSGRNCFITYDLESLQQQFLSQ
jgi:DNA mismatch repair protein MutL